MTRKEYLETLGRGLLVGALGLLFSRLFFRGQLGSRDVSCIRPRGLQGICSGCSITQTCGLPQAQSYRQALESRGVKS